MLVNLVFWIDATAVLLNILNRSKRYPIFVANRLAITEQSSDPSEWHFLPSELNVADLPSRGLMNRPIDFLNSWLNGPQQRCKPVGSTGRSSWLEHRSNSLFLQLKNI